MTNQEELESKRLDAQDQKQEMDFDDHDDVLRNEPEDDGSEVDFEGVQAEIRQSDRDNYNSAILI